VTTVPPRDYGKPGVEIPGVTVHRVPLTRTPFFEAIARALLARAAAQVVYAVHYRCGVHAAGIVSGSRVPAVCKFACSGAHGDFAVERERHPRDHEARRARLLELERFVCISEAIKKEALAHGLPPEKLVSIGNGVELAPTPVAPGAPENAAPADLGAGRVVLFVGRLDPQKRLDVLLDAFARLPKKDTRLAIAGTGPLLEVLRVQAAALGIEERVSFLGDRSDIAALHGAASVFCLPSESEGLPNALLEALALGTPVVATDIAGTNEVVRHESTALLVPVGDAPALALALERLLEDRELASRLATAGRERVQAYDFALVARQHLALFSRLAEENPGELRLGLVGRLILIGRFLARVFLKTPLSLFN